MSDIQNAFHAKDGLYFRRGEQGPPRGSNSFTPTVLSNDVEIIVHDTAFFGTGEKRFKLDIGSWASIVASVSSFGETHDSWSRAFAFHDGRELPGRDTNEGEIVFINNLLDDCAISAMPHIVKKLKDRLEHLRG
jgi:hypothetical protein